MIYFHTRDILEKALFHVRGECLKTCLPRNVMISVGTIHTSGWKTMIFLIEDMGRLHGGGQ